MLFLWLWKIGSSVFFERSVHTIIIFYKRFIVGVNAINYQLIYQWFFLQWPWLHVVLKLPMLMSFYVEALKLMLLKSLWLSQFHCNWSKKAKLLCGFPTLSWRKVNPLTPKISFIILLTVCHLALVMLVWRIWYWIN